MQEERIQKALAEWMQGKVARLNKLREGLRLLQIDIDEKAVRKETLVQRCHEQKAALQYLIHDRV